MLNYRFAGGGEERLTTWMVNHLEYSFVILRDGIENVERELIKCLRPPLNLNKWENPQKTTIERLRKACADEARRAAGPQEQL